MSNMKTRIQVINELIGELIDERKAALEKEDYYQISCLTEGIQILERKRDEAYAKA